jgi:hypothetical protein
VNNIDDPDRYGEMDEDKKLCYYYLLSLTRTKDRFRSAYLADE